MKTFVTIFALALLLSLPVGLSAGVSTPLAAGPDDSARLENSVRINVYLSPEWKVNLILARRQPGTVIVTLRNQKGTVLHREYLSKKPVNYWRKFNFEGSEAGTYQFEISDGHQTIIRQVEIVDMPAVKAQRYLVFNE